MGTPIDTLGFVAGQNLDDQLFDPQELLAAENLLQTYLQDSFPTLNFGRNSTLFDLVIRPAAVIYMISRAEWTALRATQSLQGVIENPELASDAIVDAILSNDLITRRLGTAATGRVRVDLSAAGISSISQDMTFETSEGLKFNPQASFTVTSSPSDASDLKLYSDGDGQFFFFVPVVAVENGAKYQLANSIAMIPTPSLPSLISAETFGNFQNGTDDETNAALIARIPQGKSVKNQVSTLSIEATLRENFPSILDVSTQGMTGLAMTRNAHNILGFKAGGYADIYVRTGATISLGSVSKTATLISIDVNNNATYQVSLDRDDFPGHYFVRSILDDSSDAYGSLLVLSETKDFDNRVDANGNALGDQRPNRIDTVQEATYSRFQSNTIQFQVDYDSALGSNPIDQFTAQRAVKVEVAYMPLVKEIQEFVSDRERGVVVADYLVRACIPCFVQLSTIVVEGSFGTDAAEVRLAIYNYINSLRMGDKLRVDEIISAAKSVAGVKFVQLPIQITGEIYAPNGTVLNLVGDSSLSIPSQPDLQVIPETTAFIVELPDIPVALIES